MLPAVTVTEEPVELFNVPCPLRPHAKVAPGPSTTVYVFVVEPEHTTAGPPTVQAGLLIVDAYVQVPVQAAVPVVVTLEVTVSV